MLCLDLVFRCLMQLQSAHSLMLFLYSKGGKVVILKVFKTSIIAVSFLPVFMLCSRCFQQPNGDSSTRAQPEFLIAIYMEEKQACFVCLCHHPRSHFTKLLTGIFSLGLVTIHIFSFHVWPFVFMLQVT